MVDHSEPWNAPAVRRNDRPRPLESARCSLCGIELPKGLMMPDGGRACSDVRWYCKDTKSCTERWTARPSRPAGRKALAQKAPKAPKALEAGPNPGPSRKAAPVRGTAAQVAPAAPAAPAARSVPAEAGES
jgi:hypothetical protein